MKIIFLFTLFIGAISCSNDLDDTTCRTKDPKNDLQWLKEAITAMEADTSELAKYFFIEQATYKGETVFVFSNCCPTCNTVVNVFDCKGKLLGTLYGEIPVEMIRDTTLLFKRYDSPCD
jgi:hypothetical protein